MGLALRSMFGFVVLAVLGGMAHGQTTPGLNGILRDLASSDFAQREAAQKQIAQFPYEQYDSLQELAAAQTDEEVKGRLLVGSQEILQEAVRRFAATPWRTAAHVTGRVVDPQGQALAGVRVTWYSTTFGSLMSAVLPRTETDARGRFDLALPFTEIRYQIHIGASIREASTSQVVLVDKDTDIGEVVLKSARYSRVLKGVLLDGTGKPVPKQKVEILDEYDCSGAYRHG